MAAPLTLPSPTRPGPTTTPAPAPPTGRRWPVESDDILPGSTARTGRRSRPRPLPGVGRAAIRGGFRAVGWLVVSAAVGLLLLVGVGPHTGRYRTLTALSGSMAPSFDTGDVVVAVPKPLTDLEVGDVIVYRAPTGDKPVVTHRVVEIVEPGPQPVVRTKGDANPGVDPWVARLEGQQAWEVRAVVPFVGRVLHEVRTPALRWPLVIGAPLAMLLHFLVRIWRPEPSPEDDRSAGSQGDEGGDEDGGR